MNFLNKTLLILVAALLPIITLTPASTFSQSIYYVSAATGSDVTGDGSPGNPWATIQHAVDSAMATQTDSAEIRAAAGTYPENIVMDEYESLFGGYDPADWSRDIKLNETIIHGNGETPAVLAAANSAIDGFTINGGDGGGISCQNVDTKISNCKFSNNSVGLGYNGGGTTITYCTFRENDIGVSGGGDGYISHCTFENNGTGTESSYTNIAVSFCTFSNNSGNAIVGNEASASVMDSLFINNGGYALNCVAGASLTRCTVRGNGEGIRVGYECNLYVDRCIVIGNGTGIYVSDGEVGIYVYNSIIAENGETGIYGRGENLTVINSTITGHTTYGIRGAYWGDTITNCIIWNNGTDLEEYCSATYSDISDGDPGEGNISIDPLFMKTEDGDFHLLPGSPCIDTGAFTYLTDDLDGNPRPLDGNLSGTAEFDMGAYEYRPIFNTISAGNYTGKSESDIAIFRPREGVWAVKDLGRVYFGGACGIPVSGDYNGDGFTDIGIYNPGNGLWAIKNLSRFYYGGPSGIPLPRDYDGDDCCDTAVFKAGVWSIRGISRIYFGTEGDLPIPRDYDGDGRADIAIFRPATGLWAIRDHTRSYFGTRGDIPVPGVYQWYGPRLSKSIFRNRIALFRPSSGMWAIGGITRFYFGIAGDLPVIGDFTGNSLDNMGIFRPAAGLWAIRGTTRTYYGKSGDIPVTR